MMAANNQYYLNYLGKNGDALGGTGWAMIEFGWDVKYAGVQALVAKRDAREHRGQIYTKTNNSYDMEDILMPLHELINEPIVRDIVHNGATFQIAGLTNNSYLTESHEVRHCVLKCPTLGKYVLEVAKKRLDDMLYVGLTKNHKESASMLANVVGAQVISQLSTSRSKREIANNSDSEQSSLLPDFLMDANYQRNTTYKKVKKVSSIGKDEATKKNMTVGELMAAYESCTSDLRNSQEERRTNSLKNISPANFTKVARRHIPKVLLQKITSFNSLDMELYNYGHSIFARQHECVMQTIVDTRCSPILRRSAAQVLTGGKFRLDRVLTGGKFRLDRVLTGGKFRLMPYWW